MSVDKERFSSRSIYYILLGIGELFGFLSVILVGILFNKELFANGYDWNKSPFNYHPLFMTLGLLFCYGNAIVLYRTFKETQKLLVKILHAVLLIVSLIFASFGFAAIIKSKNLGNRPHFMTYHSWMGLTTLILFILQWICGFISFLFPKTSLEMRQRYMPR
jgi:cytochrome b-561